MAILKVATIVAFIYIRDHEDITSYRKLIVVLEVRFQFFRRTEF